MAVSEHNGHGDPAPEREDTDADADADADTGADTDTDADAQTAALRRQPPEGDRLAPRLASNPSPSDRHGRFVDELTLEAQSGAGGAGCIAWNKIRRGRRGGGPAGGDGGRGGSVVLVADGGLGTLLDLKHLRFLTARNGRPGEPANRTGAAGAERRVRVPVGTLVHDLDTGELLADLSEHGAEIVVAQGGLGGRGNASFTTSTRRSPDFAQRGRSGETRSLRLTLKLMADVGLVGLPNAGKSTFIARASNARPKIAAYPFTTLVPQLGLVRVGYESFVLADIPGLVEGASAGAGLGHRFLRHVERTSVFLFLVDAGLGQPPPLQAFDMLERELRRYAPELADRPRLVALNKMDLPSTREIAPELEGALAERGLKLHTISAATGQGVPELLKALLETLGRD